ncbi:MAG: RecQ family ATP-dependent DNA helicase, partial [Bacteroidetes bacterium]|nr:RecQ family ATP-dependent DNA helicase [Bacteroidota bacterium]
ILELLQQVPGTGIVYCRSRRKTQEVTDQLALHGISADYYHAGLTMEQRTEKQNAWLKGAIRVMVCTNAFGMGIDKADVRCVVHHDVPDCLENYYQEAGRAGRDGAKSYAALLYDEQDITALETLPETRFPPPDEIKKVYRCLVNHLQIPSGSGQGEWHPFHIKDFTKAFGLPMDTAVYSIKLLEQEGWLLFAGQIFLPSQLVFTCSREDLRNAEETMPKLDPLIKGLLRSYGGILDMETTISEYQLASFMQQNVEEVREGLQRLHQLGMVHYQPQTDAPQIQFLYDRPPAAELQLSPLREMLKKQFEKRLHAMIDYVNEKTACRAAIIATYFGDTNAGKCKVCDNCLEANTKPPTAAEIEKVYEYLIKKMNGQGLSLKALTDKLSSERKAKLMTMIEYLLVEEKLVVNEMGMLFQKVK